MPSLLLSLMLCRPVVRSATIEQKKPSRQRLTERLQHDWRRFNFDGGFKDCELTFCDGRGAWSQRNASLPKKTLLLNQTPKQGYVVSNTRHTHKWLTQGVHQTRSRLTMVAPKAHTQDSLDPLCGPLRAQGSSGYACSAMLLCKKSANPGKWGRGVF